MFKAHDRVGTCHCVNDVSPLDRLPESLCNRDCFNLTNTPCGMAQAVTDTLRVYVASEIFRSLVTLRRGKRL